MLKKEVEKILVEQIEKEMYSSNLYLSMASWAEQNGFNGVSKWMLAQADEEKVHYLKFISYINSKGGKAIIPTVEAPPTEFSDIKEVFEKTLAHEEYITESINNIVKVTIEQSDFTTQQWMQWFVTEQIEEEESVKSIIDRIKLLGNTGNYYHFDSDILSMRQATDAE